jgi:uncharacterized protein (TIGR00255 family)
MIQSMTGFGSAEREGFKVEIRSLNHRFLDVSIKIPQNLLGHDMALRNMVKERFSRGRFDAVVSIAGVGNAGIKINTDAVRKIYDSLRSLKDELSLCGEIGIDTIAEFGEFISTEEREGDVAPLFNAFGEALDLIGQMRKKEGEAIVADMRRRLEHLRRMKEGISAQCDDAVRKCRERFRERLNLLLGDVRCDENRVLQEAAIVAEKTDVSEEMIRIDSHLDQAERILSDGDAIGRKLEFLIQELNREVNTIASKSDDYEISSITVDMKAELEKLREQAQNVQ